jgi:DNA-binding HxlR family transcriptional regulator
MKATQAELNRCSIASTLSLIGEKWTILILRDVFHGIRRFDDFLERLGCSPAVLSARLKTLTEAGLLRRVGYREPGARERFEYKPTRLAVELMPVLVGLMQWGNDHGCDEGLGPFEVRALTNGQRVRAVLVDEDANIVSANEIHLARTGAVHAWPDASDAPA